MLGEDAVAQFDELGFVGGFAGNELTRTASCLDLGEASVGFGGVATDEDHVRTGGGEAFGHGAAEFARAADDDGRAAFEGEEIEGGHGARVWSLEYRV